MSFVNRHDFPRPDNNIVQIDLDKTLIDATYKLTDPGVIAIIRRVQRRGITLSLNSDSGLATLEYWQGRLGMNGPIVAERGAIVKTANGLIYNPQDVELFAKSLTGITAELGKTMRVQPADAPGSARDGVASGSPGETVLLVNTLRKCSLALSIRNISPEGRWVLPDFTEEAFNSVAGLYPDIGEDLMVDNNPEYGILILSRKSATKRAGVIALRHALGIRGKFGMIGDSPTDFLGDDQAVHYAVGNARDAFKEKARYVSPYPIATGVIDILEQISPHHGA